MAALGRVEERYLGLQAIELSTVLGTVGRERGGFDRQFRPTTARVRACWERIANAARRGETLPPILRTHEWSEDILARLRESDLDRKR